MKPKDFTTVTTSLYRNDDLADDTTVVLEGFLKTGESEPVAWTRERGKTANLLYFVGWRG